VCSQTDGVVAAAGADKERSHVHTAVSDVLPAASNPCEDKRKRHRLRLNSHSQQHPLCNGNHATHARAAVAAVACYKCAGNALTPRQELALLAVARGKRVQFAETG
jgi:hypothetical protein